MADKKLQRLLTNCFFLSINTFFVIPYILNQLGTSKDLIFDVIFFDFGTGLVELDK